MFHFQSSKSFDSVTFKKDIWKYILIALIALYPLIGIFWGLDLGDTGYHLFAYTNLSSHPEKINYTTFFSTAIGAAWNALFGWMGLLGFNLLEVLLEWGMAAIVYHTFHRELGEKTTLLGCLIAIMAMDTYLNIFNYHQLNAFLLTVIFCMEYKAIQSKNEKLSLLAGVFYMLLVFSRVGSVVAIVSCFLYFYDVIMNKTSWKQLLKHAIAFAIGALSVCITFVGILFVCGYWDYFCNNIFRLKGIASDNSTSYGFSNLLSQLLGDNLKVMASGFIFYFAAAVLTGAFHIGAQKTDTKLQKVFFVLIGCFIGVIAVYQMRYAYNVNPAENWPQLTTGPRFVIGVMYVTAFLCYLTHAFRKDEHAKKVTLIVLAAYLLVVLTIAGSNTGTKHVVMAMWLIAPVCVYTVRKIIVYLLNQNHFEAISSRINIKWNKKAIIGTILLTLVMFFTKYFDMLYYTFNFDSVHRTQLTATVDNKKVRGIHTTQREADSINGVLKQLETYDKDQPLQVFGNTLLFYYLTDRDAYAACWVTPATYSLERFSSDMDMAKEVYKDTLPVIVYCRTNYAFGFDEADVAKNQWEILQTEYDGKKEYLVNYLEENQYGVAYADDYYVVLAPDGSEDFSQIEYYIYGWGM